MSTNSSNNRPWHEEAAEWLTEQYGHWVENPATPDPDWLDWTESALAEREKLLNIQATHDAEVAVTYHGAIELGRAAERTAIVEWLRRDNLETSTWEHAGTGCSIRPEHWRLMTLGELAAAIESGDHLRSTSGAVIGDDPKERGK